MPRGRPRKIYNVEEAAPVEAEAVAVSSEKEQTMARQEELLSHLTWLQTNKFLDIGQVETALAKANHRLTEL